MTHCLDFFAYLRKIKYFRQLEVRAAVDGIVGIYTDNESGQKYEVSVRPIEEKIKCRLCGELRTAQEIIRNSGDCNFCNLQNKGG